jgi:hypothetical protein
VKNVRLEKDIHNTQSSTHLHNRIPGPFGPGASDREDRIVEENEKAVVEGLVSLAHYGRDEERVVWVHEVGPNETRNLADIIEGEFSFLPGLMRITLERI